MKERMRFTRCLDWKNTPIETYMHFERLSDNTNLQLVQVGHHQTDAKYSYGPMIRDHYLIHFIRSGSGVMVDMQNEYVLHKNQCFLICPGRMTMYRAAKDSPWEYYWLGFSGQWAEELISGIGLNAEHPIANLEPCEEIFSLLDRMTRDVDPHSSYLTLTGLMFEVLDMLCKARCVNHDEYTVSMHFGLHGKRGNLVDDVCDLIENSFDDKLKVSEIAHNLGYSRSYLTELFHREIGMSIQQYITEFRLQRAKIMMRDPAQSLQQIANKCGYADPLFFSRMFKKHFGISPQALRKTWVEEEAFSGDKPDSDETQAHEE